MTQVTPAPKTIARVNSFAIAALVLGVLAVVTMFLVGALSLAVFAVGAGHIALNQISRSDQAGKTAAYVGLGIGYALALYTVLNTLVTLFALAQQGAL